MNTTSKCKFNLFLCSTILITLLAINTYANSGEIKWLGQTASDLVVGSKGFEDITFSGQVWAGKTADAVYPKLVLGSFQADADENKFLYVKMSSTDRNILRVFCSSDGGENFYNVDSFTTEALDKSGEFVIYRFDL